MSWYSERQVFPSDLQGSREQCIDLLQNFFKKTENPSDTQVKTGQQHQQKKTTEKNKKTLKRPNPSSIKDSVSKKQKKTAKQEIEETNPTKKTKKNSTTLENFI